MLKEKWKVEIEGNDCPTCVWATDEEDAKQQAIMMYHPITDITNKIIKAYPYKDDINENY